MVRNTEINESKNDMNVHEVYYKTNIFGVYILSFGLMVAVNLSLKAPITTAADDKFCNIFPNFLKK